MKSFNQHICLLALMLAAIAAPAQDSKPANWPTPVSTDTVITNTALIPVPRTEANIANRQALVLQRAKDAPGDYDIEFIGDSITQGWESRGANVWKQYYGTRKVINFGVSGDRTQHVLWRFNQGQLTGIKAKVAVVMIGTNNSGIWVPSSSRTTARFPRISCPITCIRMMLATRSGLLPLNRS